MKSAPKKGSALKGFKPIKAPDAPKTPAKGAPGGAMMAPPGLASKMAAPAKMPRMLRKGGKVRGC